MRLRVWPLIAAGLALLPLGAAEITVTGRVIDENEAAVAGAQISVSSVANSSVFHAVSNPTGGFTFHLPAEGEYRFRAEQTDFFPLKDFPITVRPGMEPIHLVLNHAKEVLQSVDVTAAPSPVDVEQTQSERSLSGIQILDVPYPSSHSLRNALTIMPGAIMDPAGQLHFDGGKENQTNYLLDGFNISHPLTGNLDARVSVEAVQSMDYLSGRYSPEYGKGSAGTLQIKTETGDNRLRYSATNFLPGIDTHQGFNLGAWTPRANVSGPIVKDRAWFSDSIDGDYNINIVPGLPKGQDKSSGWLASNLLHTQFNVTPSNILYGDFLINWAITNFAGLSPLDPPSTTINQRARTWFAGVKDQIYIARGTLLELGVGEELTYSRGIPQGPGVYIIDPGGRQGNYFLDSLQNSHRTQFLGNLYLPAMHFAGRHQFKVGFDVDRLYYYQSNRRTGYDLFGVSNDLLRSVTFGGNGTFSRPSLEASSYYQDDWQVWSKLVFELGLRQDWDELTRNVTWSPRTSFSYAPLNNTRISGGFAVVYDEPTLLFFTAPRDQYSLADVYTPSGTLLRPDSLTLFTLNNPNLRNPQYRNWTLGGDRVLPHGIRVNVSLLRRRGGNGFVYVNRLAAPVAAPPALAATYHASYLEQVFNLTNARHDQYDSAEVIVHQQLAGRFEWMASYTRSRAYSNSVLEQTIDQPLLVQSSENAGPLPWDAPNRFLSWGYLPTLWKNWAVAYLLEARSGFPFSIRHENGAIIGSPDVLRFPDYFNLNLHIERRFHLGKYRFAIRGGINNLTGHRNPTTVNSTVESPRYLTFYGDPGRHYVLRLRWLGRE